MVVATGFFDGVHFGHRFVLEQLVSHAKQRGEKSMVISFWPHPRNVLQDEARNLRLINSLDEKRELIKSFGVDEFKIIKFTKEFSKLTAKEYIEKYIKDEFDGTAMLLGYDNRIGSDQPDSKELIEIAKSLGVEIITSDCIHSENGIEISSTKIRQAITEGRIEDARDMLGYEYNLHGVVISGKQLGRKIGFPTANMQLYEPLKVIPGNGVYLVRVETVGKKFWGMCNIGVRPTVGPGNFRTIETNIFDFNQEIYGLDIKVSFVKKIRDEKCFAGLPMLREQLIEDKNTCKSLLKNL